jgi:hypothetical protein
MKGEGGLSGSALSGPISIFEVDQNLTRAKSKPKAKNRTTTSPLFDSFWAAYPRKKAKKDALKAWHQVDGDEKAEQLTAAITLQTENEFRFREEDRVPHAASWLRGERWNDETKPRAPIKRVETFEEARRRQAIEDAKTRQEAARRERESAEKTAALIAQADAEFELKRAGGH